MKPGFRSHEMRRRLRGDLRSADIDLRKNFVVEFRFHVPIEIYEWHSW